MVTRQPLSLLVGVVGLALTGCSCPPQTPQLVFPTGYNGVYKIQGVPGLDHGPTPRRGELTADISTAGVCAVDYEVYRTYFSRTDGQCLGWTARFGDGSPIPLFSPAVAADQAQPDRPMLLGLIQYNDSIYGVVDTHNNLMAFYDRFFKDLKESGMPDLDSHLPSRQASVQLSPP